MYSYDSIALRPQNVFRKVLFHGDKYAKMDFIIYIYEVQRYNFVHYTVPKLHIAKKIAPTRENSSFSSGVKLYARHSLCQAE